MTRAFVTALVVLCCLPIAAQGATPRPGAILEEHRHNTGGRDWHVQVEVNKTATRLASVVAYAMQCDETGFAQGIPLGPDGSFNVDRPLQDKKGRFAVQGRFIDADHAVGTWQITRGACSFGGPFEAQGAGGHFQVGNPYEYAPRAITGPSLNARRLRALKYFTRRNAYRFNTPAKAAQQGYVLSTAHGCPGLHHARKHGTNMWGNLLDPTAPQSLVFWCDAQSRWTLAAFMYRAEAGRRPNTFGDLVQWHKHKPASNWMTHVWLVSDPLAAFASCSPFRAFSAEGRFRYTPFEVDTHSDEPCSDSEPPGQGQSPGSPGLSPR